MNEKEVRKIVLEVIQDLMYSHNGIPVPAPFEGGCAELALDPLELKLQAEQKLDQLEWE